MTPRTLLVLGENGQVARALADASLSDFSDVVFAGRAKLDLGTVDVRAFVRGLNPAAVINAAAYTAVDRAESEPEAADLLNARMPGAAAAACADLGVPFVHISTDYVFDGSKGSPYVEDDPLAPLGVYGKTKAAGELAVESAGAISAILRTSWVYGAYGANFMKTMLRLAATRDEIGVVADQRGAPTLATEVAEGAIRSIRRLIEGDAAARGVFHVAGGGDTTWAGFAKAIFEESGRLGGPAALVKPITTEEYPTTAKRPQDSRLSTDKFFAIHGWRPGPWRDGLSEHMAQTGF